MTNCKCTECKKKEAEHLMCDKCLDDLLEKTANSAYENGYKDGFEAGNADGLAQGMIID